MATNHHRTLSYTEVSSALTCLAQWDFSYGGRLAGDTLRARGIKPILSRGRAWGAMVAAWHAAYGTLLAEVDAFDAMRASLDRDYEQMSKSGVLMLGVMDQRLEIEDDLSVIFAHYTSLARPLGSLTRLEDDLIFPVPSRSGKRASNRYRFQAKIDGFHVDREGNEWIWECKFRGKFPQRATIERARQLRWYAWSRQRETNRPVAGVILDERLDIAPKPARIVQDKRRKNDRHSSGYTVSDVKDQMTTPELYMEACAQYGIEPNPEVIESLAERKWQRLIRLPFLPSELDEAGRELTSAGILIGMLDSGHLYPIRNAQERICNGCDFKGICNHPTDRLVVDLQFERRTPKRLKDVGDSVPPQSSAGAGDGTESLSSAPNTTTPQEVFF